MTDEQARPGDIEAALDFAEKHLCAGDIPAIDVDNAPHLVVMPHGQSVKDLTHLYDPFRERPRRLDGCAHFHEVESLCEHINRFKDDHSVIFAERGDPDDIKSDASRLCGLTAIYDYNQGPGAPRFGDHKAWYGFPFSTEWRLWMKADKKKMDQGDFAAFMEDNLADLVMPTDHAAAEANILATQMGLKIGTPSDIMQLSKGLQVTVKAEVVNATVLQTGESTINFATENKTKVEVPGLFLIGIPVVEGGERYQLAVRLRYRAAGGLVWWFEVYRPEVTYRDAFDGVVAKVKDATGLPVWFGMAE